MLIQNQKNKLRNLNNLSNQTASDLNELEISQIAQDNRLDLKSLFTNRRIVTLSSGWFIPEAVKENDDCYEYEVYLMDCPLYLIPYITVTVIGKENTSSRYPTFQIYDSEEEFLEERIEGEQPTIKIIQNNIRIYCGVLVGAEVKILITIINPKEFI